MRPYKNSPSAIICGYLRQESRTCEVRLSFVISFSPSKPFSRWEKGWACAEPDEAVRAKNNTPDHRRGCFLWLLGQDSNLQPSVAANGTNAAQCNATLGEK